MKITLVQTAPRLNRTNLADATALICSLDPTDAVVFPELALSGYLLQDKLFEDAWTPDELASLAEASRACDIIIGGAVKTQGRTYNGALCFSQGELKHLHRKLHLPNYGMFEEARYFFRGDAIESFETAAGKTVMLVCEDLWRAATLSEVAAMQPDIIYVLANSPARGFEDDGLAIEAQWDALLKSLALLSSSYVIFVNRVGFEDGLGFWGGSRVITPRGKIENRLPLFESATMTCTLDRQLHRIEKWMAKID